MKISFLAAALQSLAPSCREIFIVSVAEFLQMCNTDLQCPCHFNKRTQMKTTTCVKLKDCSMRGCNYGMDLILVKGQV